MAILGSVSGAVAGPITLIGLPELFRGLADFRFLVYRSSLVLLPRKAQLAVSLSYANRRRLKITRALAAHPRILLLDEPTAGMNPTETEGMVGVIRDLKRSGFTVLLSPIVRTR